MVNLGHEASLLQKIEDFAANGKIQNSVGLTKRAVESKIRKLIPTTKQRTNAAKLYLDLIKRTDLDFYLKIQDSPSTESEMASSQPFIDFSDDGSVQVQIKLLENTNSTLREKSALIVFIVLNGFFSNLVSLEDCIAKIINIAYDLIPSEDRPSYIRQALDSKIPIAPLTTHLRTFHAIGQDGKLDKTGSPFNIAREIRNELVHDDIAEVVFFPTLSLIGLSDLDLYFNNSFFRANTSPKHSDTEIIAFCKDVYQKTVDFVDECYRLIHDDLQHSGSLPV